MRTVLALYALVLGQPMLLLRLGGIMMAILVVYELAFFPVIESLFGADGRTVSLQVLEENRLRLTIGFIVFGIIVIWLTTMVAVRWHRYMLLGPASYRFFDVTFGGREWRFVGNGILVGLLAYLVFWGATLLLGLIGSGLVVSAPLAVKYVGPLIELIAMLPALYVVGRCGLVFPATAIGQPMRIRDSWTATQGRGATIAGLLVAMALPAIVVQLIPFEIEPFSALPGWLVSVAGAFARTFFLLITTALWASALSHAYRT